MTCSTGQVFANALDVSYLPNILRLPRCFRDVVRRQLFQLLIFPFSSDLFISEESARAKKKKKMKKKINKTKEKRADLTESSWIKASSFKFLALFFFLFYLFDFVQVCQKNWEVFFLPNVGYWGCHLPDHKEKWHIKRVFESIPSIHGFDDGGQLVPWWWWLALVSCVAIKKNKNSNFLVDSGSNIYFLWVALDLHEC